MNQCTHLYETAFITSDQELERKLHRTDNRSLHRNNQMLQLATVLQDDGKGVISFALHAPQTAIEGRDGLGASKQQQSLIDSMTAQPIEHAVAGLIIGRCPAADPRREVDIVMDLAFGYAAEGVGVHQLVESAEVGIVAAIYAVVERFGVV